MGYRYSVFLTYNEDRTGGDRLSDEMYSDREDEHIEFSLTGAWTEHQDQLYVQEVKVPFNVFDTEKVYVVVVRYSTGDTFGKTYGAWHIEGVYSTSEEADKIAKAIQAGGQDRSWNTSGKREDEYAKYRALKGETKKNPIYLPWQGYFERLESISVEPMNLDSGKKIYKV